MPMKDFITDKNITPGSDRELAIKRAGVYVPQGLVDALVDKIGTLVAEIERFSTLSKWVPSIVADYKRERDKNEYYAQFRLPFDRNDSTLEAAYKEFEDRFNEGRRLGTIPPSVTWERHEKMEVRMKSDNFMLLMQGVFDGQINPMIEALNAEKGTGYSTVDYRAILRDDPILTPDLPIKGKWTENAKGRDVAGKSGGTPGGGLGGGAS